MDFMKSVPELEADYLEIVRNLDSETIALIESSPTFPEVQRGKFKLECAHAVYWQIQALKSDLRTIMWHPV